MLGTAATIVAAAAASAADLPVKAKAVEYVKVCTLYGAGFYYIPGTDTCMRIGGMLRVDTNFNSTVYDNPVTTNAGGRNTRDRDWFVSRARQNIFLDTRTATEYGVLRTYSNTQFQWSSNTDAIAAGNIEVDFAFIQFAGFTFGKAVSMFDPQWIFAQPQITSGLVGGSDNKTGLPQLAYTATFGNGVSGTISLEDVRPYRRGGIYDATDALNFPGQSTTTFATNSEGGDHVPDIVGNLRLDQEWGSLHFAGALHQVTASYNGTTAAALAIGPETTGHPDDKWGYAVSGAFELKNLPTGIGDSFRMDATYAHGAARYVSGGTNNINGIGYSRFGGSSNFYQSVGFGIYDDATFQSAGGPGLGGAAIPLQLSDDYGIRAWYEHYWNPAWRTSLFGAFMRHEFNSTATSLLLAKGFSAAGIGGATLTAGTTGNFNFNIWQIGSRTAWTPVKDLTFGAEVMYTRIDQNLNGAIALSATSVPMKPAATYELKDQGVVSGVVQVIRSF